MSVRTTNQGMQDANSASPLSFVAGTLINTTSSTTVVSGVASIFHGFLAVVPPSGVYTLTVFDANTTAASGLTSATTVGVLGTTTGVGATLFQWGGEIICNNGITVVSQGGTAGAIRILYL